MPPKYDPITNVQTAINMAVAENRAVRFLSRKSNAELKKEILDKKGCQILKSSKESEDCAAVPAGIDDFDFNKVDTSIIWMPGDPL